MANRTKRTPEKGEKFLKTLRQTGGNVSRACKAEGIARRTAYDWRNDDADFAAAWDEAVEAGLDDLEQEAYRRAFRGTRKPVYQGGKLAGHVQEYSDTLAIFLLKGGRPNKYRDRQEIIGNLNVDVSKLPDDELAALAEGAAPVKAPRAGRD